MTKETQHYFYCVSVTLTENYCSLFHDLDCTDWASEKHKSYEQVGGLWQSYWLILLFCTHDLAGGNLPGERAFEMCSVFGYVSFPSSIRIGCNSPEQVVCFCGISAEFHWSYFPPLSAKKLRSQFGACF